MTQHIILRTEGKRDSDFHNVGLVGEISKFCPPPAPLKKKEKRNRTLALAIGHCAEIGLSMLHCGKINLI